MASAVKVRGIGLCGPRMYINIKRSLASQKHYSQISCTLGPNRMSYKVLFCLYREMRTLVTSAALLSRNNPKRPRVFDQPHENISSIPVSEVTPENQHELLADILTPLWRVPYEEQLKKKFEWAKWVVKNIQEKLHQQCKENRLWKNVTPEVLPVQPSPVTEAYRNKDELNVKRGIDGNEKTVGYYIGSPVSDNYVIVSGKNVINIKPSHYLVAERFQEFIGMSELPACVDLRPGGGNWKSLLVRSNEAGHVMVVAGCHPQSLSEERLAEEQELLKEFFTSGPGSDCHLHSLYFQACRHLRCTQEQAPFRLLHGEPYLMEQLGGYTFRISPDAFFQVNTQAAEVLYNTVLKQAKLSPMTTLLDICCGIGTISILASRHCRCCVGLEVTAGAVRDARVNAKTNNITNVDFILGRVERRMPQVLGSLSMASDIMAIVNPGRGGLLPSVVKHLNDCPQLRRVIYISCKADHPTTLHNFAHLCSGGGFRLKRVVPVDLFPHTLHTELVMVFVR